MQLIFTMKWSDVLHIYTNTTTAPKSLCTFLMLDIEKKTGSWWEKLGIFYMQ